MTVLDPEQVLPVGVLVGDELLESTSVGTMPHHNPATGKVQRHFVAAGPAEVDAAVVAARAALPGWRAWRPVDRRDALLRLADLVRVHGAEFAAISTLEAGMIGPIAAFQAPRAAEWIDYYAGWADKLEGASVPMPGSLDYTVHEPMGVVAIILTWNGPTGTIGMKVPAALAAGCTVVLKPAELAPFSSVRFGELCLEAGFPPGVVNVVPGGADAGDALVRHPGIDKISFTGGPATAQRIQAACAETLTPLLLELGGKSANLVFADADLEVAAFRSAAGIAGMSGQACVAPTRLLVQDAVYEEVVERVLGHLSALRLGDPQSADTTMGPVISSGAADRIVGMIDRARAEGSGQLLLGGERAGGDLADGYFVPPTVFGDVAPDSDLAQSEVFGPVLSVIRFGDEAEALEVANDTAFGLAAYIHTSNVSRAIRLAGQLDAGNVSVNGGAVVAGPYGPFGGFKRSGHGKEGGLAGLLEYTRTKNVNIAILP
jgi:aldehyde dehydrogenase (NAD+)